MESPEEPVYWKVQNPFPLMVWDENVWYEAQPLPDAVSLLCRLLKDSGLVKMGEGKERLRCYVDEILIRRETQGGLKIAWRDSERHIRGEKLDFKEVPEGVRRELAERLKEDCTAPKKEQIFDCWRMTGHLSLEELSLLESLASRRALPPIAGWVKTLEAPVSRTVFTLHLLREACRSSDRWQYMLTPEKNMALEWILPGEGKMKLAFHGLNGGRFLEEALGYLEQPGRFRRCVGVMADSGLVSCRDMTIVWHALFSEGRRGLGFGRGTGFPYAVRQARSDIATTGRTSLDRILIAEAVQNTIKAKEQVSIAEITGLEKELVRRMKAENARRFSQRYGLSVGENGWDVESLDSMEALAAEGFKQENCLRNPIGLLDEISQGEASYYSLIRPHGMRLTVKIGSDGEIAEILGPKNNDPAEIPEVMTTKENPEFRASKLALSIKPEEADSFRGMRRCFRDPVGFGRGMIKRMIHGRRVESLGAYLYRNWKERSAMKSVEVVEDGRGRAFFLLEEELMVEEG